MLHYSDVKCKGHQRGQPVIDEVNTKPTSDVTFSNKSDPVFERGGRVYSVRVDQPYARGVMRINPKERVWPTRSSTA